jgi:uncharacterized phage-associated protein
MAYSSLAVANFFIGKSLEDGIPDLTPMKLQKLVYYAHGWHLALNDTPLLTERVEAWPFGPVISNLYHETKKWGNASITNFLSNGRSTPHIDDPITRDLLESIWSTYSKYSANKLSNATHIENSPWDQVMKKSGGVKKHLIIDDRIIADYFTKRIHANA